MSRCTEPVLHLIIWSVSLRNLRHGSSPICHNCSGNYATKVPHLGIVSRHLQGFSTARVLFILEDTGGVVYPHQPPYSVRQEVVLLHRRWPICCCNKFISLLPRNICSGFHMHHTVHCTIEQGPENVTKQQQNSHICWKEMIKNQIYSGSNREIMMTDIRSCLILLLLREFVYIWAGFIVLVHIKTNTSHKCH